MYNNGKFNNFIDNFTMYFKFKYVFIYDKKDKLNNFIKYGLPSLSIIDRIIICCS